jgi:hypothetical protein
LNTPLGTRWQNNSCAYDAVITLLFNIWRDDAISETESWHELRCDLLDSLTQCFHKHEDIEVSSVSESVQTFSLEHIRDFIRRRLARLSAEFTFGRYASVHSVTERLLKTCEPITTSNLYCPNSHVINRNPSPTSNCKIIIFGGPSLQVCVDNFTIETASKCSTCNTYLSRVTTFVQTPPVLAFDLGNNAPFLNPVLWISCRETRIRYSLRGIIYFENDHFTERVITRTGMVWFHDGMLTGRSLLYETDNLTSININHAVMAFYARDPI